MSKLCMKVAGRELEMFFDLQAWLDAEETFGSLDEMYKRMEDNKCPMKTSLMLAVVTANAGERKNGRAPDLTLEWMTGHMTPKQARTANTLAKMAVAEGLKRETTEAEDDEPVDVVAEELQKKTEEP